MQLQLHYHRQHKIQGRCWSFSQGKITSRCRTNQLPVSSTIMARQLGLFADQSHDHSHALTAAINFPDAEWHCWTSWPRQNWLHTAELDFCRSKIGLHSAIIIIIIIIITRGQSNLTKKAPHRGPIPRLGVAPGGRKLYHWIPGVGFPISVP